MFLQGDFLLSLAAAAKFAIEIPIVFICHENCFSPNRFPAADMGDAFDCMGDAGAYSIRLEDDLGRTYSGKFDL